jgi:transcriptional regulator with PAS, ATPase and Fis domain
VVLREARKTLRRVTTQLATRYRFEDLVGHGLHASVALARSASSTHMPVLLLGESGVGKEVFAQAIHAESPRREGPFIAVNCAALSRELVESELFGYVGGAFSGARSEGAVGRFEAANGGTLFLDEIGDLPLPAQAALLRALQERVVTPVGSSQGRAVDVRVVSATNHRLDEAVKQGTFRLDLLHRLNVIAIAVPPLRERMGDLGPLVQHLSAAIEAETGLRVSVPSEVRAVMERHTWPGNVRELDNVLRRLAVLGRDREVTVEDLPFAVAPAAHGADLQVQRLLDVIHSARNMAEAAAKLGINRSTLYRQLERLGLKPRRTATPGS